MPVLAETARTGPSPSYSQVCLPLAMSYPRTLLRMNLAAGRRRAAAGSAGSPKRTMALPRDTGATGPTRASTFHSSLPSAVEMARNVPDQSAM